MRRLVGQRGFTLAELGIVLAVLAILVVVVLVGKGFVRTTQAGKVSDSIDVVRKGVATVSGFGGGQLPSTSTLSELPGLVSRGFVPSDPWPILPGWSITNVQWSSGTGPDNRVGIRVDCPEAHCINLWDIYNKPGMTGGHINSGAAGTLQCTPVSPNQFITFLVFCFEV